VEDGMTLASQLKQKAIAVNSDRMNKAAKARQIKRKKEARQVEVEIARTIREKEKEKKRKIEKRLLISWLSSGLQLAWEGQDRIFYSPKSDAERILAKKYLGYTSAHPHVQRLNKEFDGFVSCAITLQNRLENLKPYAGFSSPPFKFDATSLINSYKQKNLLFSAFWREQFRRQLIQFEKVANSNFLAKVKEESKRAKSEADRVRREIAEIPFDRDIVEVTRLADELRPNIKAFRSQHNHYVTTPESFFKARGGVFEFRGIGYVELINRRDFQFAVARHVLNEMNIHYFTSQPDSIGKSMAAFRVAAGEDLFDALLNHVTDRGLLKKINVYNQLLNSNLVQKNNLRFVAIEGKKVDVLVSSFFGCIERIGKVLKLIDVDNLKHISSQFGYTPSVKISELFATTIHPDVDRLAYDIQWLGSVSGKRFKKEFTKYLDEIADLGKLSAKFKVFSVNDGLIIELPSGKEILCDMVWDSFEKLLEFLGLEITETTSTGIVKIKWN
jgi:hypothetical protein